MLWCAVYKPIGQHTMWMIGAQCFFAHLLDQGLSKHQEMSFTPVTKVLQSNEGT